MRSVPSEETIQGREVNGSSSTMAEMQGLKLQNYGYLPTFPSLQDDGNARVGVWGRNGRQIVLRHSRCCLVLKEGGKLIPNGMRAHEIFESFQKNTVFRERFSAH